MASITTTLKHFIERKKETLITVKFHCSLWEHSQNYLNLLIDLGIWDSSLRSSLELDKIHLDDEWSRISREMGKQIIERVVALPYFKLDFKTAGVGMV